MIPLLDYSNFRFNRHLQIQHKQLPQQIRIKYIVVKVKVKVFNGTYSNSSAMLVEETKVPGKYTMDMSQVNEELYHIVISSIPRRRFELSRLVVKIYIQSIIHLYYLSTMSTVFFHD